MTNPDILSPAPEDRAALIARLRQYAISRAAPIHTDIHRAADALEAHACDRKDAMDQYGLMLREYDALREAGNAMRDLLASPLKRPNPIRRPEWADAIAAWDALNPDPEPVHTTGVVTVHEEFDDEGARMEDPATVAAFLAMQRAMRLPDPRDGETKGEGEAECPGCAEGRDYYCGGCKQSMCKPCARAHVRCRGWDRPRVEPAREETRGCGPTG